MTDERTFTEDEVLEAVGLDDSLANHLGVGNVTEYKVSVRMPDYERTGMWSSTFLGVLASQFKESFKTSRGQEVELTVEVVGGNTLTGKANEGDSVRQRVSRKFHVGRY